VVGHNGIAEDTQRILCGYIDGSYCFGGFLITSLYVCQIDFKIGRYYLTSSSKETTATTPV